jgi:two-component system OmpR family sensor kinase/two-component system sensor histidine kinase BaeS
MKLRLQLFLGFALIIAITLTVVALFANRAAANEIKYFVNKGGAYGVVDLVTALEDYYKQNGSWEGADQVFRTQGHSPMGQGMGKGRQDNFVPSKGSSMRLVDVQGVLLYDPSNVEQAGTMLTSEELTGAIPLSHNNDVVGYLLPAAGVAIPDEGFETTLLERLKDALLNAALIAGGISLVLAVLLAYIMLRPVRQLTVASVRLAKGDLSQRVSVRGNDELATLGRTFNHMAASLEEAENKRRAMTADIAHELRTPLAVQRASLEALLDGVYPLSTENLESVAQQNVLITHLVDDLRTLALVDAGELTLECVPGDITSIVKHVMTSFQPQAAKKNIEIIPHLPEKSPLLNIDPLRIQQVLNNLMQNAIRHTPTGGRIHLLVVFDNNTATLSVRDTGGGIPEDALPHVFERFYRADKGRSRADGGTGLGLAIARKLTELHEGRLRARNHPEGGAEFILELPI